MAKNYFNRYIWLIDLIQRSGHISFEDIDRAWRRSTYNEYGESLSERTFFNHKKAIYDTFDIEIKCDRSLGYYISNDDDVQSDALKNWMLQSLSLNNIMNEGSDLRDRIICEDVPSSQKWLPEIMAAMRDGKKLEMTYQSFWKTEAHTYAVAPYCLKLFKQRWYMLAKSDAYEHPRIYALDRIHHLTQTKQGYTTKVIRTPIWTAGISRARTITLNTTAFSASLTISGAMPGARHSYPGVNSRQASPRRSIAPKSAVLE